MNLLSELPLEIIAYVVSFLPNLKKIEFKGANKKIYEACPITLRKKYFLDGHGKKFDECVVKMSCMDFDRFVNLRKLTLQSLFVTEKIILPDKLEDIKIIFVNSTKDAYVELPKSVRKFKVSTVNCNYFPFILNEGLLSLKVPQILLKKIPSSVIYCEGITGVKLYAFRTNLSSNITNITLSCECPDFIEVPVFVKKFTLYDYLSVTKKTIKFHEGVKRISLHCIKLEKLQVPRSVKTLKLGLDEYDDEVSVSQELDCLMINISVWNLKTVVIPRAKKISLYFETNVAIIFPEGVKKLFWGNIKKYTPVPVSVENLSLGFSGIADDVDLSGLLSLKILDIRDFHENIVIPQVKKLSVFRSKLGLIPDSVVNLELGRDVVLTNVPSSLKKLHVCTNDIEAYLAALKIDKEILVTYYGENDVFTKTVVYKN